MLIALCCPFIAYNKNVKRTLNSFKNFIIESKKISQTNHFIIISISSNKSDLRNDELIAKTHIIKYTPPKGVYSAFNLCIKESFKASSELIWIIGEGDTIYKPSNGFIKTLSKPIAKKSIIVGSMIIGDRKKRNKKTNAKINLWLNLDKMRLNHPSMIISKYVYQEIGFYSEDKKIISDYEWCMKAFEKNINIIKLKNFLTYHELGGISTIYGKSRLNLHIACINVIYKSLGFSLPLFFAIFTRFSRFILSRFFYYIKKINKDRTQI